METIGIILYLVYQNLTELKRKKANIFIKAKWFMLILLWKFKNRKWTDCRHKRKALEKYKDSLMKGYKV